MAAWEVSQCAAAMFKTRNLKQGFVELESQYHPPVLSMDHTPISGAPTCVLSPGISRLFFIPVSWESAFLQSSSFASRWQCRL